MSADYDVKLEYILELYTVIQKRFADVICKPLTDVVYDNLEKCYFPNNLKEGDITAIYKKDEPTNKKNYRPITILPSVSKIYERLTQSNGAANKHDTLPRTLWISKRLQHPACPHKFS